MEFISLLNQSGWDYPSIWNLQKERVESVFRGELPEALIFCEHENCLTSGRRSKEGNILDRTYPIHEIERGGDVTLHGPGQLVIYPILKLNSGRFPGGLHEYLRFLEQAVIDTLEELGLKAGRFGPTGVWVKRRGLTKKIASIGIAVRHWVTYHGVAINVTNDISDFQKIRPCDFESSIMTSLKSEGVQISVEELASKIRYYLEVELLSRSQRISRSVAVGNHG